MISTYVFCSFLKYVFFFIDCTELKTSNYNYTNIVKKKNKKERVKILFKLIMDIYNNIHR